ncbi:glycoside hydrolase family 65 protein [Sandaracinus amylolyticus]|uniref:glycoside hydrolase family 65 protein n=1 Tax=Sandaracinus amylolyticus TaxID=927083 RepID=UPI00069CF7AB|nr:glycosyl hydrolase family 65 protein [Sandaracinus amylolyticus]
MIDRSAFEIAPWAIVERSLRLDRLATSESVFALSNGHIGLRGNLDEGEPHREPGSYLNGFFEALPLPYAEPGYGYPEEGQTLLNVTNGKLVRLLVDDEPFDVRYGTLERHKRVLDLRDGVLRRDVMWTSPAGQAVRVRSTRLVSFVQRAIAAVCYEVEAIGAPARIVVQSSVVANEPTIVHGEDDPRSAAALRGALVCEYHTARDSEVAMGHRARVSGLRMAAALDHVIDGPEGTVSSAESETDLARVTVSTELAPGRTLRVVKLLAYGWSAERSMPALRDQVDAALSAARRTGWDGLLAAQRAYLDTVWEHADVEIDGDPELQQAMRFAIFQIVQAAARAENRAIPAKGLTGRGYDGHTFWDMDTYTLPVLTYTTPDAARDALRWRHSTLPLARARAAQLHLRGACFPWRTIRGEECSGYWPAGTAAFHVNADIADAVRRYVSATGDTAFERDVGVEMLVETARLWASLGHHDAEGGFRIDGVTGPDEYTALCDNNTFTNLMAARNLRSAASAAERHPERAAALGVDGEEIAKWREAAGAIVVPFDTELGVTAQCDGFTRFRRWRFEDTPPDAYPLLLHFPYYLLYSSQVVKQADLVLALFLCGEEMTLEQKRRDFEHYEAITVRDSTLSASIQGVVAAEVGHLELAYEYFRETALVDLRDIAGNTADGLHLAALSGAWLVAVAGFGGMRDQGDVLAFAPRLVAPMTRLAFHLLMRGRCIRVDITPHDARYELRSGDPIELEHHGERFTLEHDASRLMPCPVREQVPTVAPPAGREPFRRGAGADAHRRVGRG